MGPTNGHNLRELLASQGRLPAWVAQQLDMTHCQFSRSVLARGRTTPSERQRLAEVLGVSLETIDAALAETERRPGARDRRGRKARGAL